MIDYGTFVFIIGETEEDDMFDVIKRQLRNQLFSRDVFHYASILYECIRLAKIIVVNDCEFYSHTMDYSYSVRFVKKSVRNESVDGCKIALCYGS